MLSGTKYFIVPGISDLDVFMQNLLQTLDDRMQEHEHIVTTAESNPKPEVIRNPVASTSSNPGLPDSDYCHYFRLLTLTLTKNYSHL